MVYDCFSFFNELDLLEIRLNELNPVVDKFVLVEATRTHQKKKKPLYYAENKSRYAEFNDKIIHVVVDDYPTIFSKLLKQHRLQRVGVWDYENHQRNAIMRGLTGCKDDDVIIISDMDEIPGASKVRKYAEVPGVKIFEQRMFYCYLNSLLVDGPETSVEKKKGDFMIWMGSLMLDYKQMITPQKARDDMYYQKYGADAVFIEDGGWHFSYMGGAERVVEKLKAYAHIEFNKPDICNADVIRKSMMTGKDVLGREGRKYKFIEIDDSYPLYVRNNQDRYANMIMRKQGNIR